MGCDALSFLPYCEMGMLAYCHSVHLTFIKWLKATSGDMWFCFQLCARCVFCYAMCIVPEIHRNVALNLLLFCYHYKMTLIKHHLWVSRVLRPARHNNRSFRRRVFPGNYLHWYWQVKTNKRKYTKNTKSNPIYNIYLQ